MEKITESRDNVLKKKCEHPAIFYRCGSWILLLFNFRFDWNSGLFIKHCSHQRLLCLGNREPVGFLTPPGNRNHAG